MVLPHAPGQPGRFPFRGILFKGCRQGIRLVLPIDGSFQTACAELAQRLAVAGEFFRGARMILDQTQRPLCAEETEALRELLAGHGIELLLGHPPAAAAAPLTEPTETLRSPVRSGQKVTAEGNLLIMGDVHAGATASAGGDLIILGAARGILEAGLIKGRAATVLAFQLRPALIRLGDLMARSPAAGPRWRAEMARVLEDRIVVEPFLGWQRAWSRQGAIATGISEEWG